MTKPKTKKGEETMTTEDEQILELIQDIKSRKEKIAKAEKPKWKTNCSFSYTEGSRNSAINIQVCSDVVQLLKISAFLTTTYQAFENSKRWLGVDEETKFHWDGFGLEEWTDDIGARIAKIQISQEKTKLEALESRLNSIVSPETRRRLELEAIKREMGK